MKRPEGLSKKQLKYVEYLESKIKDFSSHNTKVTSYHSNKKLVDELNKLMLNGIELPVIDKDGNPTGEFENHELLSYHSLSSKEDKVFDRIFKFFEKQDNFLATMERLSEQISPEEKEEEHFASEYEEMLSKVDNG
jgi:hypothetical protein